MPKQINNIPQKLGMQYLKIKIIKRNYIHIFFWQKKNKREERGKREEEGRKETQASMFQPPERSEAE